MWQRVERIESMEDWLEDADDLRAEFERRIADGAFHVEKDLGLFVTQNA